MARLVALPSFWNAGGALVHPMHGRSLCGAGAPSADVGDMNPACDVAQHSCPALWRTHCNLGVYYLLCARSVVIMTDVGEVPGGAPAPLLLHHLSENVLEEIFGRCDFRALMHVLSTCKYFKQIVSNSERVWLLHLDRTLGFRAKVRNRVGQRSQGRAET